MFTEMMFGFISALVQFGLKFYGTKMFNELLDRISLDWYEMKDVGTRKIWIRNIKDLDMQARAIAVRRKKFFK